MFRPETYKQVKEKRTIGVLNNHRKRFTELSRGDRFVTYLSKVSELDSYGEIIGAPYQDASPICPGWERYEHRCPVKLGREGAHVDARNLLFRLSPFQTGLRTSPTNLLFCKGGFMKISKDDFDLCRALIDKAAAKRRTRK